MKKWISVLAVAGLLSVIPQAQAFHVSGTVHGFHRTASSIEVVGVPITLDTLYIMPLIILPPILVDSTYEFTNFDSGGYMLIAYQDLNVNLLPDLDEPRGFYGNNGLPTPLLVTHDTAGVDIQLNDPTSGGFSGHVTYNGTATGTKLVMASRNADFSGTPNGVGAVLFDSTGAGSYTAFVDSFGTYYAYAFMDVNGNFTYDADEPYGIYGGDQAQQINIQPLNFPTNINIQLNDPQTPGGVFFGHVTYSGASHGAKVVVASRREDFGGSPSGGCIVQDTTSAGYYTASVDSFGIYYAYAYMDVNGNNAYDSGEPYGVFGGTRAAEIAVEPGNFPSDIDIVLADPQDGVDPEHAELPSRLAISQIYPNPFNSATTIRYTLAVSSPIELSVYNMLGQKVKTLMEGFTEAGEHTAMFEGVDLPSGLYVVRLKTAAGMVNGKMLLLK